MLSLFNFSFFKHNYEMSKILKIKQVLDFFLFLKIGFQHDFEMIIEREKILCK